jgi:hypothetical protein
MDIEALVSRLQEVNRDLNRVYADLNCSVPGVPQVMTRLRKAIKAGEGMAARQKAVRGNGQDNHTNIRTRVLKIVRGLARVGAGTHRSTEVHRTRQHRKMIAQRKLEKAFLRGFWCGVRL